MICMTKKILKKQLYTCHASFNHPFANATSSWPASTHNVIQPPPYGAWLRARGSPWPNATHGAKKKHTRLSVWEAQALRQEVHIFNSKVGQEMTVFQQTVAFQEFTPPKQKHMDLHEVFMGTAFAAFFLGWETIWRRLRLGSGNGWIGWFILAWWLNIS